jgi:predicted helicase
MPSIDGIALSEPRLATIDIVPAIGRAIRKPTGKQVATIVLPVYLSTNEEICSGSRC